MVVVEKFPWNILAWNTIVYDQLFFDLVSPKFDDCIFLWLWCSFYVMLVMLSAHTGFWQLPKLAACLNLGKTFFYFQWFSQLCREIDEFDRKQKATNDENEPPSKKRIKGRYMKVSLVRLEEEKPLSCVLPFLFKK